MSLNHRQTLFARAYIAEQNGTQAAIAAGYSPKGAAVHASRMLKMPKIRAFIDAGLARGVAARNVKAIEVHGAKVLGELSHIAHSDLINAFNKCPGNLDCTAEKHYCDRGTLKALEAMSPEMRAAIASIEFTELFEGSSGEKFVAGRIVKLKLWDKPKALEMLGRNQKLFTDKVEVSGLSLEQLIDDAVARAKASK